MSNTSSKRTDVPLKIGITGGIGSGKSLVCSVFRLLGIPVFHADQVAKDLYTNDERIRKQLVELLGPGIYSAEGILDRQMLASVIFNDKDQLEKVNEMVHPLVMEEFDRWLEKQSGPYVLLEAAILFETGIWRLMDANILVSAPVELRIKRVMERDHIAREEVVSRMRNQSDEGVTTGLADYIIRNDESSFVIKQVLETDRNIRLHGNFR